MSEIGRRLMVPPLSLTIAACEAAVADAGLTLDDIDGLSTYPGGGNLGGFGEGGVTALEAALGIRPTWHNGGIETFGPGGSVIAAMLAIAGGLARHVLCFRTLWEATFNEQMKQGKIVPSGGRRADWLLPFGATSAAHTLAQNAQRHFHRYGTTKETLGWIALNQRANAELNPTAVYRSPMTMDDYLHARPITTPFGLYDCDVPCDGAIAVIVSAVDAAQDTAKPPVFVDAVGTQIIERIDWDQSTLTHEPQVLGQAAHLWSRTSLKPADVDVAELYDGFTMNCLSWIEALGILRHRRGERLPRRRQEHRPRRPTAAEHARRPAVARPHPRHGSAARSDHPIARRGRRTAGRRRPRRSGQQRRPDAERRAAAAGRHDDRTAAQARHRRRCADVRRWSPRRRTRER